MFTENDSHLTIEFKDHYVITPSMPNISSNINYKINKLKERGKLFTFWKRL